MAVYITHNTCIYIFIHVGNYTYAAVRGHETYELLRDSLSPVWRQVAELIHNPAVCIDGRDYTLEIVYGADYKVHAHEEHAKIPHYYHTHHVCHSTFCL